MTDSLEYLAQSAAVEIGWIMLYLAGPDR